MVNFSIWISDCDYHSPPLFDLFISSDACICSTMAFPTLANFDHDVVSVCINFPSNSKGHAPFHWLFVCWEMFHARVFLNLVLLLQLLVHFVSWFSFESGPNYIPVVVLKKCESELSYILAWYVYIIFPKESCFSDCWKVSYRWCLYLWRLGIDIWKNSYHLLVFSLWLVKSLKNL